MKPVPIGFPSLAALVLVAAACSQAYAQTYDTNVTVQTFAGSGFSGYVDGVGQQTMFYNPNALVADSVGNLFVWDSNNYRIRKITPEGTVSTFVGGGNQATGTGTDVNLEYDPLVGPLSDLAFGGMTIDRNNVIWAIFSQVDWVFPQSFLYKITGDASVTRQTNSIASNPQSIAADSLNNLYVSAGNQIFKSAPNAHWVILAGSGNYGTVDGTGIFSSFASPTAMAVDSANNIYVSDNTGFIRRVDPNQNVVTIAGNTGQVYGLCVDGSGNVILGCFYSVRRVGATGKVTTMAGSSSLSGYTNGPGNLARFAGAEGVCISRAMIFVADSFNHRIRQISFNSSPQPVLPADLQLDTYPGLQIRGTVGRTYQIQTSGDMNSWSPVSSLLLTSSPYLWVDQSGDHGNKFYRVLLLP